MILKTNNGNKEIKTQELDFANLMCDLEDNGVDIMALLDGDTSNIKIFNTMRSILAVLVGESDIRKAGSMLSEHMRNGGAIEDILSVFTEAMASAGFGESAEEAPEAVQTTLQFEKKSNNARASQK